MGEEKEDKLAPKVEMHTLKPNVICNDHEFVYKTGNEVMCKNCPLGYQMGWGAILKDGHIYIGEQLLI